MKILVTGGAGFIGSHLCHRLVEIGHDVCCLDNFYTGRRENVADLLEHPRFHLVCHDVTQPWQGQMDQIYNLACPASPVHYQQDPVKTIEVNVLGVRNLLQLAQDTGARLLQASTSEVYGDPIVHPQQEGYWGNVNPIGIRSCYDEGKRMAETMCFDYHRQYGVEIKVARIFNTYGPNMQREDGRVISNFIVQALRGEALTIYGDGTQTRSFCYISDLVDGLIALMNTPPEITGPINLGNPQERTILQMAQQLLAHTGNEGGLVFLPLPQDDPKQRRPDITLAKQLLQWEPSISLEEGLTATISYFRTLLAQ